MKRLSMILMSVMLLVTLSACGQNTVSYDALGLAQVKNGRHLEDLIGTDEGSFLSRMFGFSATDETDMGDGAPETGDTTGGDHSETNVQVEGIDEADIVKTDGERIYYIRHDKLTVVEIASDGSMTVIHDEVRSEDQRGRYSELYITGGKLVAIGTFYDIEEASGDATGEDTAMEDQFYFPIYISKSTVDIYDIDTLTLEDSFEMSGQLTGSRLIGDTVYLISSHRAYSDAGDPRPYFKVDGERVTPDYDEIKYLPDMPTRTFTVISTIKLEEDSVFEYDIFLGVAGWGQLYVSENAIYMSANYYRPVTEDDSDTSVDSSSVIHGKIITYRFTEDGSVEYGGSGEYRGRVINQFAMDEHEGTFRMVTTAGWGEDVINRLYVFERAYDEEDQPYLREIAMIDEGIGKPRETVRSVRFDGDIVTVVTFEQTDPYYVIDLSDPENPTIQGELEMPGFSTYQHPWKDDTVIGVGYETDEEGQTIGLKLSLYDISDREKPTEIGESLVLLNEDSGWQYGEALHNHKAILVSETHDFIGFAINSSAWGETYEHSSDYLIFDIDASRDTPVEIAASISHIDMFTDPDEKSDHYYYSVNRAVTINDSLYVLSNAAITRHGITDGFTLIESIILDEE